jgi:hypothetical protein
MAEQADKHELYELSVQNVENEIEFLQDTFRQIRGRAAHVLREDFCGTASACCQWVRQGEEFQAIGVDIDASVLEWGRNNRLSKLETADRARVRLIESDVRTAETPKAGLELLIPALDPRTPPIEFDHDAEELTPASSSRWRLRWIRIVLRSVRRHRTS